MDIRIRAGDVLLYRPAKGSLIGRLITIKTWSPYSHAEVVIGNGRTISARSEGVHEFPMDWNRLGRIVRPTVPVDVDAAMRWFHDKAEGQRYDWFGLFRFFTIGKQSLTKQFCSEVVTRWLRAGGVDPFPGQDADLVPPGYYANLAQGFTLFWSDGKP